MCQWHCAMTAESRRAASAIYSLISSFLPCIKALVISLSLSAVLNLSGLRNATAVCCAPVYSPPVMLNFASHLTRMQDSVLQSVTLWCSDVILKFAFIALFLISCFPAGLIGSHNEVIQLNSMDRQHIKLCVYSLAWRPFQNRCFVADSSSLERRQAQGDHEVASGSETDTWLWAVPLTWERHYWGIGALSGITTELAYFQNSRTVCYSWRW